MFVLSNDQLTAKIHPKGAELQELRSKNSGINYMWSGDPAYWGKFSPILFPIVGTLKNNLYRYNGNEYSLPRHGFARDREFSANQESESSAVFTLVDDAESRKNYPFPFKLEVHYSLAGNKIICQYIVSNTGDSPLLFSIGAHPAFAVPLFIDGLQTNYEDYWLDFDTSRGLKRYKLSEGLISDETTNIDLVNSRLPLSAELFREDAIVLKQLPDSEIMLGCNKHGHGLRFKWNDFPFFGIWAAPNAPFVCLEPWCGIADSVNHDQELEHKEGIERLGPAGSWTRSWNVIVY